MVVVVSVLGRRVNSITLVGNWLCLCRIPEGGVSVIKKKEEEEEENYIVRRGWDTSD